MKKVYSFLFLILMLFASAATFAQDVPLTLSCEFTVATKACVLQEVKITYTGGASVNATYTWNFDGANVLSGSGQGPYFVQWTTPGEKHVVLSIHWEGQTCTKTLPVIIVEQPAVFHMTGGGTLPAGGAGVAVGLSGSQVNIIYKLFKNGQYAGIHVTGTGNPISFGLINQPGNYTCLAYVDGSECSRHMEGVAVVSTSGYPPAGNLCMVTFDTASQRNKLIWNKPVSGHIEQFNIYKETYQNNVFSKIAEVPYAAFSIFIDTNSNPLVKSFRYALSIVDTSGHEGEKGPAHKSIHLNINPGIFGFNLIWNHYLGFEFKTYKIYRKLSAGPWVLIDSVASNVDSYTDLYTTSGLATYYIGVVRLEPCNPSLKSGSEESSISNVATSAPLGVNEDAGSGVLIYPNPVKDKLIIALSDVNQDPCKVELYGVDGRKYLETTIQGTRSVIDLSALPGGLYIVRISGNNFTLARKVFRQ